MLKELSCNVLWKFMNTWALIFWNMAVGNVVSKPWRNNLGNILKLNKLWNIIVTFIMYVLIYLSSNFTTHHLIVSKLTRMVSLILPRYTVKMELWTHYGWDQIYFNGTSTAIIHNIETFGQSFDKYGLVGANIELKYKNDSFYKPVDNKAVKAHILKHVSKYLFLLRRG